MPYRTPGNHRRYPFDQIEKILSKNNKNEENKNVLEPKTAENNQKRPDKIKTATVYARVSQPIQKQNGDLDRQIDALRSMHLISDI
ncbi:MAG: hypothetical protein ACTSRZ_17100 [Promethearchaeota archaeon]